MRSSAARNLTPPPTIAGLNRAMAEGRVGEVLDALRSMTPSAAARALASDIANLSWRAGEPEIGLRWLQRYVRPPARRPVTATPMETLEYAQCLIRMGALAEGAKLLDEVSEKQYPLAMLYKAGLPIGRWDYAEAIPLLESYCAVKSLSRYARLVGQTNLAAAYVFTARTKEATALLRIILHETHLSGYRLLLMRALELSAENFFVRRKWQDTEKFLKASERTAKSVATGLDAFFVEKFRAVVGLFRSGGSPESLAELARLREYAFSLGIWETVRECDRLRCVVTKDTELARKVWFGTPYPNYRKSLEAHFPEGTFLGSPFHWILKQGKSPGTLDLELGKWKGEVIASLAPGSVPLRLLRALSEDFYRPRRIAELFASIHPDRHFNVESSPNVVANALFRTRRVLEEAQVPLQIGELNGFFRLHASAALQVRIKFAEAGPMGERLELDLARVRQKFGNVDFSVSQAEALLNKPKRTVLRLLQSALESGHLKRWGAGRSTRYRFQPRETRPVDGSDE